MVNADTKFLYDVLENEAESGGLAKEYMGEHHDSFIAEPSHKIYHWYADNDTKGSQVLTKNNVIFANHCWQLLRTTDTGGTKMIYNGEVVNGKCLNNRANHVGFDSYSTKTLSNTYFYGTDFLYDTTTKKFSLSGTISTGEIKTDTYTCNLTSETGTCSTLYYVDKSASNNNSYYVFSISSNASYSQIGKIPFNLLNSLDYAGYMLDKQYKLPYKTNRSFRLLTVYTISPKTVYYSNNIEWNEETGEYELVNPSSVVLSNRSGGSALEGKYTFLSDSPTKSSSSVNYVVKTDYNNINNNYNIAVSILKDGQELDDVNDSFTYGDSYIKNDNGTYTINNASTFHTLDLLRSSSPYLYRKYICMNAINNTCDQLWYSIDNYANMNNIYDLRYYIVNNDYKYSNDVIYQNGQYILSNNSINTWNYYDYSQFYNYHYTCFNESGICDTVSYLINYNDQNYMYYINLNDGKTIDDIVDDSFNENDNTVDSTVKKSIDLWYKHNLLNYEDFLEETIYCNDRVLKDYENSPFNKNGGKLKRENVQDTISNSLKCSKKNNSFSTHNNDAKLEYSIGLPTSNEINLLNNYKIWSTGQSYWTSDMRDSYVPIYIRVVPSSGESLSYSSYVNGVRPVVSLNKNVLYKGGNGTVNNPYLVSLFHRINIEISNLTEDLNINIEDLTQVSEGEEVNFKVTPIKGHKLTSIRIIDKNNNEVEYNTTDNKNYTFAMPASDVTIIPSYEKVSNGVILEDNQNTKEFVIEVEDATAVVYEDKVKIKVVPEEGYELEKIIIKDKNNNNISYKKTDNTNEYEFIMPDTDVIITPVYRKVESNYKSTIINPKTIRPLFTICILFILLIISILVRKKIRLNKDYL